MTTVEGDETMALSVCSDCKNYSEGVCLLGQSYVHVFQSVQDNFEPLGKDAGIISKLAGCLFWEKSELAQLFSCMVTLSYQAWEHIAYLKLNGHSSENFKNLLDAARSIVMMTESEKHKTLELQQFQSDKDPDSYQDELAVSEGKSSQNQDLRILTLPPNVADTGSEEIDAVNPEIIVDQKLEKEKLQSSNLNHQEEKPDGESSDTDNLSSSALTENADMPNSKKSVEAKGDSDSIETIMEDLLNMSMSPESNSQPEIQQGGRGTGRIQVIQPVA
jgi:hypothetical protein